MQAEAGSGTVVSPEPAVIWGERVEEPPAVLEFCPFIR